jgi:hypothetical protein
MAYEETPLPDLPTEAELRAAALRQQQMLDPRSVARMRQADPRGQQGAQAVAQLQAQLGQQGAALPAAQFARQLQLAQERRQQAEEGRRYFQTEQDLQLKRDQLTADQWGLAMSPTVGEGLLYNKKTGQTRYAPRLTPAPAGGGKGGEAAMKLGGNIGTAASAMKTALEVGFPEPNLSLASLAQSGGQLASRAGLPQFASKAAEQTHAAWYNVISPIVHARSGQQMSVQELQREASALMPRPGESPETHLMHAHQLMDILRKYTTGLPPNIQAELLGDIEQAEALLPRTLEQYNSMRARGGGAPPFEQPGGPQSPGGQTRWQGGPPSLGQAGVPAPGRPRRETPQDPWATRPPPGAPPPAPAAPGAGQGPARPRSKAERDALPPGTQYIGPDGRTYRKA